MTALTATASRQASSTAPHFALPSGSVAGEIVFVFAINDLTTTPPTFTAGTAIITAQAMGSASVAAWKYTLTAGDIINGYLALASGSAITCAGGIFNTGVSAAQGTATFAKRASSSTSVTAPAATITAGDTTVVIFLDKATAESTAPSVTPAITVVASYFSGATSTAGMELGYYTGSTADRVFTASVASGNGAGIQVGYTPASGADPNAVVFTFWDGSAEQPLHGVTFWDGSAEQPLHSLDFT